MPQWSRPHGGHADVAAAPAAAGAGLPTRSETTRRATAIPAPTAASAEFALSAIAVVGPVTAAAAGATAVATGAAAVATAGPPPECPPMAWGSEWDWAADRAAAGGVATCCGALSDCAAGAGAPREAFDAAG